MLSTLRISGKDVTKYMVASLLVELKIEATIFETLSSVEFDDDFVIETGVSIDIYKQEKEGIKKLWDALRKRFDLSCAHIKTHDFSGCIFNYLRPSECPFVKKK